RVRTKLGAVLTIPAVAFLAVAGFQTDTAVRQAGQLQHFTRQVQLARQITALVHELQRERDRTAGVLATVVAQAGGASSTPPLGPSQISSIMASDRAGVDQAAEALRVAA